jgi:hypothetical protein
MTDVSESGRRKTPDRRQAQRRDAAAQAPSERRSLVVSGPAVTQSQPDPPPPASATASAAFAAQLLGQPGAKRGLKGGVPVLNGARSAYLETEYLGKGERRLPKGVITRQDI